MDQSQARYLELGILEQLESSASTGDRKEMINEFVQHNLLCEVAIILLACIYPWKCTVAAAYQKRGSAEPPLPPLNPPLILNHNVSLQYSEEFHTVIILDQEFMNIVIHYCYPKLPKQPVTTHANHNEHILNRFRNRTDSKHRIWLCNTRNIFHV